MLKQPFKYCSWKYSYDLTPSRCSELYACARLHWIILNIITAAIYLTTTINVTKKLIFH